MKYLNNFNQMFNSVFEGKKSFDEEFFDEDNMIMAKRIAIDKWGRDWKKMSPDEQKDEIQVSLGELADFHKEAVEFMNFLGFKNTKKFNLASLAQYAKLPVNVTLEFLLIVEDPDLVEEISKGDFRKFKYKKPNQFNDEWEYTMRVNSLL